MSLFLYTLLLKQNYMKKLLYGILVLGCISSLVWGGWRLFATIQFGIHCERFLSRSAEATTVDIAKKQLCLALNYCKTHKLTSGYTSIILRTDDENIGIWYDKLQASYTMLDSLGPTTSQAKNNAALVKLRKTLLGNDGSDKPTVIYPQGIALYPYNRIGIVWGVISIVIVLLSKIAIDKYP